MKKLIATVSDITKLKDIKYLPGFPEQYRFDAKKGTLKFRDTDDVTDEAETFSFVVLAFRIFTDSLFTSNYGRRKWVEFFSINEAGHVCSFLVHGFSVENLETIQAHLYYDGIGLKDVVVSLRPRAKANDHGTYYIADFSYKLMSKKDRQTLEGVVNTFPHLYRAETYHPDAEMHLSSNYSVPEGPAALEESEAEASSDEEVAQAAEV